MTSEDLEATVAALLDGATEDLTPAALTGRVLACRRLEADLTAVYAAAQKVAGEEADAQADASLDAFQAGGEAA